MTTTSRDRRPRGVVAVLGWILLGALVGVPLAGLTDRGPGIPASLFAGQEGQIGVGAEGEYVFFTFRRNLWAVHQPTGTIRFFMFPDGKEQPMVKSGLYSIDRDHFPPDEVRYQLSERNLTNYLWILNPITGKAQYIRARRDGVFEPSLLLEVEKQ